MVGLFCGYQVSNIIFHFGLMEYFCFYMKRNITGLLLLSVVVLSTGSCGLNSTDKNAAATDTLQYVQQEKMLSYTNCVPDSSSSCTYIHFSYPGFTGLTPPLQDSVSEMLTQIFTDGEGNINDADSLQQKFIQEYSAFVAEQKDYSTPWYINKNVNVLLQNKRWITFSYSHSSFTGGAHGMQEQHYILLDRNTGKRLKLFDFFDSTAIYKLTALADPLFRSEKLIAPSQTYEEAGYWFKDEHFYLNNNFYIHKDGITFCYNPYEVSSYANGSTVITIPAAKIGKLVRKEWMQ